MTPLPAPLRWLYSLEWRRGFFDWARSDGVTWVYIFKVLFAAFLTLWLAMRLELPQPRTAMITVFIVMQPQSGQVFAKSFYRFLGTLAGSAVMVALIALFAQNTELFLGSLAIWVGICSAGAARYRNFRAYGFVLAGYTAAMVGLPALAHPDGAFMAAVWRVLEISLGILCATVVSAAILPQTASAAMRNALYQRFGVFALFVTDGLRGRSQRDAFEASNVRFIAEAVGLEGLRSVTVFEDPHMRRRNGRLSRLNSEFMGITTRFNALHQLLERLRSNGTDHVVAAIKPGLQDLAELLDGFSGRALTSPDAARLTICIDEPIRQTCRRKSAACGRRFSRAIRATPSSSIFIPPTNCSIASSTTCTVMHRPMPPWPITATSGNAGTNRSPRKPTGWHLPRRGFAPRSFCWCWAVIGSPRRGRAGRP